MEECRQGEAKYLPMENETVYKMWSISSSFRSPDDKPVGFISRFTFLSLPPALRQSQAAVPGIYVCQRAILSFFSPRAGTRATRCTNGSEIWNLAWLSRPRLLHAEFLLHRCWFGAPKLKMLPNIEI